MEWMVAVMCSKPLSNHLYIAHGTNYSREPFANFWWVNSYLHLIFGGSLFYELVWISAHYIILEGMNRSRLASGRSRNLQLIAVKYTKACEECPLGTSRGMPLPPPSQKFFGFQTF